MDNIYNEVDLRWSLTDSWHTLTVMVW